MEILLWLLRAFLWLALGAVVLYYLFLMIFTNGWYSRMTESSVRENSALSEKQKENFFKGKIKTDKAMHRTKGFCMVIATVILAFFGTRVSIVLAMLCACLAVWNYYRASRIAV